MKTPKFISLILVVVFTTSAFGQIRPRVTGSGKVVSEDRKAGYFNAVKVSSGIDVYLTQGQKESIRVEADDNLHEYIATEIKDNTLKVYSNANIRKAEAKKVYVGIKDVESYLLRVQVIFITRAIQNRLMHILQAQVVFIKSKKISQTHISRYDTLSGL